MVENCIKSHFFFTRRKHSSSFSFKLLSFKKDSPKTVIKSTLLSFFSVFGDNMYTNVRTSSRRTNYSSSAQYVGWLVSFSKGVDESILNINKSTKYTFINLYTLKQSN